MVNQRNFFARECPCLYLSGQFWTLIKSILEPLQTPESSEGSEDEGETRSKGEPEYAKPKGIEQKTQETLKATFCTFVWGGRISFTSSSSPSCLNCWSDSSFSFLATDPSFCHPSRKVFGGLNVRVTWTLCLWHF